MLANGATLSIQLEAEKWTNLPGLKEIPDLGMEPEKVENTCLTDALKQYELGIGDPGDMEYRFKLVNNAETDSYRILRTAESSGKAYPFKETLKDGTTYEYTAQPTVKRNGGGVNDALDFTLGLALQSAITITDPTA